MTVEPLRIALSMATVLAYAGLCLGILWREQRRQAASRRTAVLLADTGHRVEDEPATLVLFASQTGQAEAIAWRTGRGLHALGVPVRVLALDQADAAMLAQTRRALFIASTYGEGDAPDGASLFVEAVMEAGPDGPGAASGNARWPALAHLSYGVLALGDRQYDHFCGFGRTLDTWLQRSGAKAEFERIEADNLDPQSLALWQQRLGIDALGAPGRAGVAGAAGADGPAHGAEAIDAPFKPWRLRERACLNPGSAGGPIHRLVFDPPAGESASWASGDLAQVQPPGDDSRARDYSIASIESDGCIELLVRQEVHADGSLGVASGWLTSTLAVGNVVALRLRAHARFRLEANAGRPLILIGNGTGLAGLRSHLRARARAGSGDNWLIFGERNARFDSLCHDEIEGWHASGMLARVDRAFSRDQAQRHYVQHVLRDAAQPVREWLDRGAAVYVCGSLEGMAGGVDAALRDIAGPQGYALLLSEGRYRRDVY